jgi:hypothetical protein
MRKTPACMVAVAIILVACDKQPEGFKPRDQMTQREKDSILGASILPGANVVRRALAESDSAARRASAADSSNQQD